MSCPNFFGVLVRVPHGSGPRKDPCTLISNSEQDNSEEYKRLLFSASPRPPSLALTSCLYNNQLQLHTSHLPLCCMFLSDLIPLVLLLLYHCYPCSFPFTDIILLDSYKYASPVPVFSILDIKVVLCLIPLSSCLSLSPLLWLLTHLRLQLQHWIPFTLIFCISLIHSHFT